MNWQDHTKISRALLKAASPGSFLALCRRTPNAFSTIWGLGSSLG
jgi:hypothetical protein